MKLPSLVLGVLLGCASLSPTSFAQSKEFKDQVIKEKSFANATLNGADFSESTLELVSFDNASLKKANFKGAQFKSVSGANANFSEADFREMTRLVGYFESADFSRANLQGLEMSGNFFAAKFLGANLKNTKGWEALGQCDFSGADLRGANFRKARLFGRDRFQNAIYDENTTWPDGFDPKAAGCKLADGK